MCFLDVKIKVNTTYKEQENRCEKRQIFLLLKQNNKWLLLIG